ncbi:SURF1 family cytochrome oxidase biogenesis protein [Novosphingobium sp. KA1]|uniref:SURF1 family cytochrome oxidase biogenesis protein n=1 Tax=Novosphingobium sp. (strain KA1) TaxID=164608 RepID=UPI001A8C8404|nr:SURF1 family cytochrome oxidase biogenesis protein [Novosphingobium sp. KA1]QSR17389.1 hypothetical protein CA833_09370 [Novosphingobium sp. KA1]
MPRIPILPTLIVLAAVAVMVKLGFWQLDRLQQKEALLREYAFARASPQVVDFEHDLLVDGPGLYGKVALDCTKVGPDQPLAGRNAHGEPGWAHQFDCAFPMRLKGEAHRNVVIGWSNSPAVVEWHGGRVVGTLSPDRDHGERVIADPPLGGLAANAKPDPSEIPNNHLAYAVQWFLFAATALVIYGLALLKRGRK